jgi:asparagine synthase (glutamine-hydrolysing)
MCGIAGIYRKNGISKKEHHLLDQMLDKIEHRGPDSRGSYLQDPNLCFGSVRLAMIDTQNATNWLTNEEGSILLVYNGEVYNHKHLKASLESKGHRFSTDNDGEVLIHLYEEEGIDFLHRLDGMFAFALWDARTGSLLLARDPLGIKPLYYQQVKEGIVFASELKGLFPAQEKSLEIDPQALLSYLHFRCVMAPNTIYRGISKLEPGSFLLVKGGQVEIKTYWDPLQEVSVSNRSFASLFSGVVEETARSDHSLGVFLSGGMDSGVILSALSGQRKGVPTFTIGYDYLGLEDEGEHALELACHFESNHHYYKIKDEHVSRDLEKVLWHLDEPLYSTVSLSTYALSRMASKRVKGVLTGDGSDEFFLGYSYLLKPLKVLNDGGDWEEEYRKQIGWMFSPWKEQLVEPQKLVYPLLGSFGKSLSPLEAMRYFEVRFRLPEYHLSRVDRLSMSHGLEARLPYLRKEVVGWLLQQSPEKLLIEGEQKAILRDAFKMRLPLTTVARKKQPFTAPTIHWLQHVLKEEVHDLILTTDYAHDLGFKKSGLCKVLDNCYSGDGSSFSHLWGIYILYKWYQMYSTEIRMKF